MNAGYSHLNEPVYFLQSCYLDIHHNSYSSRNEILCSEKKIEMEVKWHKKKMKFYLIYIVFKKYDFYSPSDDV